MRETLFARSSNWKKHKLCLSILLQHLQLHRRSLLRNDEAYVCYRRQWNPCHMDFGLVFQQAIDRQDRTLQTEGRFSLLEPLEIQQPQQESLPLPDKDSSHDDMPCRTTPLRLLRLLLPERRDTISQTDTSQETLSHRAPP